MLATLKDEPFCIFLVFHTVVGGQSIIASRAVWQDRLFLLGRGITHVEEGKRNTPSKPKRACPQNRVAFKKGKIVQDQMKTMLVEQNHALSEVQAQDVWYPN